MHSRFAVRAGRLTAVASSRSRGRSCRLECANGFEAGDRLAGWSRADSNIGPDSVTNAVYLYAASGCTTNVLERYADGTERNVSYTWTDDYRLASVSVNGAAVAEYAYDVLGNLVAVANDEESFEILVNNGHSLADVAADGRTLRVYMRAPGVDNWLGFVDMTGATPVPYFYVTDHLGSVLAVTDADGNLAERYEYDAWGKVLSVTDANGNALARSSIGNRILWQAREYSWTTGLYYFRNRWYDPIVGRWINKDPIGIEGGINLYEFCCDNPQNRRDPSGEVAPWIVAGGIGAAIGGLVGGIYSAENGECVWKGVFSGIVGGGLTGVAFGLVSRASLAGVSTGSPWVAAGLTAGIGRGAGWGMVTGALGGAASGVIDEVFKSPDESFDWGHVLNSAKYGAIGGLVGGGISGLAGDALNGAAFLGVEGALNFITSSWSQIWMRIKNR